MKTLITDQLIEEYQKEVSRRMNEQEEGDYFSHSETKELALINGFISRLQSLRQEEEQNIIDAVENGREIIISHEFVADYKYENGNDYLTSTFKQEAK